MNLGQEAEQREGITWLVISTLLDSCFFLGFLLLPSVYHLQPKHSYFYSPLLAPLFQEGLRRKGNISYVSYCYELSFYLSVRDLLFSQCCIWVL